MSFGNQISKFVDKTNNKMGKVFRGTALSVFSRVVMRTPVGNSAIWKNPGSAPANYTGGRLRGGWHAQINIKTSDRNTPIDEDGSATINKINGVIAKADIGDTLYLINNMPYSIPIESGRHSKQAPAGMVKVTVAEFQRTVRQQAKK